MSVKIAESIKNSIQKVHLDNEMNNCDLKKVFQV